MDVTIRTGEVDRAGGPVPEDDRLANEPAMDAGSTATIAAAAPSEVSSSATGEATVPAGSRAAGPDGLEAGSGEQRGASNGCTLSQLRRFVKSRPYVPLHELRRRFALNGNDDDVVPLDPGSGRLYVGLPEREARLLEELLRHGEVGYECSLDPPSPIIVGVYPMRPVPRQ